MNGPEFNAELQCTPIRLGYDFTRRVGTIHIMRNDRCAMAGCTALFERIDRQVERITVFSGAVRLLDYVRVGGEWRPPSGVHDRPQLFVEQKISINTNSHVSARK
jgi:hypothetical protein